MSKELVSIIVPCYNHAQFIIETLSSVLQSSYTNIEIIIVNDGSTDNSEEIALEFCQNRPNILYLNQKNSGPASARNHGIHNAKGKYILPLDADDVISIDYIEKAVHVFENESDVKLVYCEAEFFGDKMGKWALPKFSLSRLAKDNMIFITAMFKKNDWQNAGGFSDEMTWGWEDWEFWISLLKNGGRVVRLPITGFYYRVRKGSRRKSTNRDAKKKTIELINAKHKGFIYQYLKGPLRFNRSWSRFINTFLVINRNIPS